MENCSIYSHHIWYQEIVNVINNMSPNGTVEINGTSDAWESIVIWGEKANNKSQNKMTLTSRVRETPDYKLGEPVDELTTILNGIRNYFGAVTGVDEHLQKKIIYKIASINMEIGIVVDNGFNAEFEEIVLTITDILEGIIFSNNNSIFEAPDANNGLFDENSDVIICESGYSDLKDLKISIEDRFYNEGKLIKA